MCIMERLAGVSFSSSSAVRAGLKPSVKSLFNGGGKASRVARCRRSDLNHVRARRWQGEPERDRCVAASSLGCLSHELSEAVVHRRVHRDRRTWRWLRLTFLLRSVSMQWCQSLGGAADNTPLRFEAPQEGFRFLKSVLRTPQEGFRAGPSYPLSERVRADDQDAIF